jgi:lycopene cyclase domain-containing protein
MASYLWINILIILIPLILSFESKIKFYRKFSALFISIFMVGIPYIIWDVIATQRGDWTFESSHLIGVYLWNLPIEEVLFFITVPYASIFLYETLCLYISDADVSISFFRIFHIIIIVIFAIFSFFTRHLPYTSTVSIFFAAFFVISLLVYQKLIRSKIYWIFISIMFIPFLMVNYLLTSLPIVTYNPEAFSNIRITTIPLEDFFYSFSMLSFNLLVYRFMLEKWQKT